MYHSSGRCNFKYIVDKVFQIKNANLQVKLIPRKQKQCARGSMHGYEFCKFCRLDVTLVSRLQTACLKLEFLAGSRELLILQILH